MSLAAILRQRALEIGFDLVGIAPATPGRDLDFAREWLERGYGGEMHYLANPQRFDPRHVLSSVKSVICVGLMYNTAFPYSTDFHPLASQPSPPEKGCSPTGERVRGEGDPVSGFEFRDSRAAESHAWISRYAWGRDYHEIMREKLGRLRTAIEELAPGVETRVHVDTGPIVERAFARFSGLGWMGKNTCIINEEKGSWFFLGVVLTNLALEPDLPAPDRCGTCRACLDACPTGALVEPYVMDASRCISYLTIELKGPIPRELRPGVGVNVFGCDICQDVCPWNSKGRDQVSGTRCQERGFEPMLVSYQPSAISRRQSAVSGQRSTGGRASSILNPKSQIQNSPDTFSLFAPSLEALATMTEGDFRHLFAHSPIKRAKYRGWLRNLCVAMGNSGDARFVPALEKLAAHADPTIREHAAWALGQLRSSD